MSSSSPSRAPFDPVIMIGMHRSGTSALTRALERLGLFVGAAKDVNDEALFFQRINVYFMGHAGAGWTTPEPFEALLANAELRALLADYARQRVSGPGTIGFLGWQRALGGTDLRRRTRPWGWKDPRNTYTLPLWLDVFPRARVVHIRRNGVDVALSLKKRESEILRARAARYERRKALYRLIDKSGNFALSAGFPDLETGFRLWDRYLSRADAHCAELGERALTLNYEDFVADPLPGLRTLVRFIGLDADADSIAAEAERLDSGRANSYRSSEACVRFAEAHADILARHGYTP
ncbi:MAG: sulfotransferase [Alphaproteobacteria bacterium]|nr:sulfotransferase [Alphaproteobacteria bacterium]